MLSLLHSTSHRFERKKRGKACLKLWPNWGQGNVHIELSV